MPLKGLDIIVGQFAMSLFGFHSPCHSDTSLVLGIGDCSSDAKALVQPGMDAVPLLIWIKIKSREPCRHEIKGVDMGLDSHINDGIDATIPIWT